MVQQAGIIQNSELISEKEWMRYIDTLEKSKKTSDEGSKEALKQAIIAAVNKRIPREPFGILFSGGVDCSLIALLCKQAGARFTCYCVGFQEGNMGGPPDIIAARKAAQQLGIPLIEKTFSAKEAEPVIREAVRVVPKPEIVDNNYADYVIKVGVASVVIAAAGLAREKIFFSGLGAEEIFAGYERHAKAKEINGECWSGLHGMWQRDLLPAFAVCKAIDITALTPFLDQEVIVEAMGISGEQKIRGEHKKVILREIAEELGLPHDIAWRKKQGAQYGSRFNLAIKKLAVTHGMRYKKEYLRSLL
ncbi:asparagine synthase C-terminal domain-containing protein [Candidatus Woesearchaeota archaeon]|nr:asparagine synthase C-terminal domain-containing protein [Candidatus Woesearchaeota archaeon]